MPQTEINSPVTGTVWKIERTIGDRVEEGDVIMILESMKMEIPIEATTAGTLQAISVEHQDSVNEDQLLCVVTS
ncbi:MAG TPA: acetyl-CoA carboxylase biotin carboxyl carrier protein subunit [Advenella sp.]|nr:acetyl-CoA carboxylase biotin carboxyl carrier protein subunit [Advenella sp.]